jgi:hypothetical protein
VLRVELDAKEIRKLRYSAEVLPGLWPSRTWYGLRVQAARMQRIAGRSLRSSSVS